MLRPVIVGWNYCFVYCCDYEGYPKTDGLYQSCKTPIHDVLKVDFNCGFFETARSEATGKFFDVICADLPTKHVSCWKNEDFFDPCEFHTNDPDPNSVQCDPLQPCVSPRGNL